MNYSFDTEVAKEYGVNAAIMIKNFQFWIIKHRAEEKNFFDGCYWTYNSVRGWSELFSFWSPKQIRTILDNLVEKRVLKKGNYNQTPYDRTLWYAFVDEAKWIGLNKQIDLPKQANEIVQIGEPIPDINTDNKTIKNNKLFFYGEHKNVKLTKDETLALIGKYGWYFESAIEELSGYLKQKNKKYESHYAVLRKNGWVWDKVHEKEENGTPPRVNLVEDPSQPGGLRKETPLEYYTKKYDLDA